MVTKELGAPTQVAKKKGAAASQPGLSLKTTHKAGAGESQRHKLFQKQLSQTIKLTGISSGISPKASGDNPVEVGDSSGAGFFKFHAAKTSNLASMLRADLASAATHDKQDSVAHQKLPPGARSPQIRVNDHIKLELESDDACEVRDSIVHVEAHAARANRALQHDARPAHSPYYYRMASGGSGEASPPRALQEEAKQGKAGLGPLPTSPKHNRLSTLPSLNTLQ